MTSLTRQLVRYIEARPITEQDLEQTLHFTLDALANAIAGCNTDQGRILLDWYDHSGKDARTLSLLIGGLTHILETDDLHKASVVHPGCVVVPAVWAVGQENKASGRDMLTAILKGFEAACRIGMAVGPAHYRIWHNTATCGPFGAAMGVGALLGLDEDQLVHALGNAGSQSSGLWQFLETGAMTKHMHAGRAADAGVLSAQLAQLGFTGPPEILEGEKGFFRATCDDPEPGRVMADPEAPWQVHLTSIKPWPSCRHTHPAIEVCLNGMRGIEPADITEIKVQTYGAAIDVCDRPDPQTVYEAKFSLQHCIAIALLDGKVDFSSFEAPARERAALLRSRVRLNRDPDIDLAYPVNWGTGLTLTMGNGDTKHAITRDAFGDPENPLSYEQMAAKCAMLVSHAGHNDSRDLVNSLLEALRADVPVDLDLPRPLGSA